MTQQPMTQHPTTQHLMTQPPTRGLNDQDQQHISDILSRWQHQPGALLPILHELQDHLGYIPSQVVPDIAKSMGRSRAEIHGVISFYHHFRTTPPGSHQLQICRGEACQAMGAKQLENHARQTLEADFGETTRDREITLSAVYCLGNCACGPSVNVDNQVVGRMDPDKLDKLVRKLTTQVLEIKS